MPVIAASLARGRAAIVMFAATPNDHFYIGMRDRPSGPAAPLTIQLMALRNLMDNNDVPPHPQAVTLAAIRAMLMTPLPENRRPTTLPSMDTPCGKSRRRKRR